MCPWNENETNKQAELEEDRFSHRAVDDWNSLPRKVVEVRYVEQFEAELDEAWDGGKTSVLCTLPYKPQIPRSSDLNTTRRAS